MTPSERDSQEPGLEDRLRRIDEIVAALDSDALGLDQALALFEEGVAHVGRARQILAAAELKVEELVGPAGQERRDMTPSEDGPGRGPGPGPGPGRGPGPGPGPGEDA